MWVRSGRNGSTPFFVLSTGAGQQIKPAQSLNEAVLIAGRSLAKDMPSKVFKLPCRLFAAFRGKGIPETQSDPVRA